MGNVHRDPETRGSRQISKTLVAVLQREVAATACDIIDENALDNVISSCRSTMPPVRGRTPVSITLNVRLPSLLLLQKKKG
ncbi:hypothetical protein F4823DRAFT_586660 [Ustulina deusta]|nr:hypothetical protein F4823DRAFT_586660 [Ustulina deusta]